MLIQLHVLLLSTYASKVSISSYVIGDLGLPEFEIQKAAIVLKYFAYNWASLQRKKTVKDVH